MPNITHAGRTLTIDDVEYELSPIKLEDLEYMDIWIMSRVMEASRLSLPPDIDESMRNAVLQAAATAALRASVFDSDGLGQLMRPLGAARFLCRLLRGSETKPTMEQCFKWLVREDIRNDLRQKLLDMFRVATGMGVKQQENPSNGESLSTKQPSSAS